MSMKATFSQNDEGQKVYYKYMVFSNNYDSPEMLYLHHPIESEVDKCFRVMTLPSGNYVKFKIMKRGLILF